MKFLRHAIIAIALCLLPVSAQAAATCFWVAGTSWNTAADWASSSGGSGGTCAALGGGSVNAGVPGGVSTDIAKLDASSPASTTLLLDVSGVSLATLDTTALTGNSGFNANGNNIALGNFAGSGTGTRTITCGSGTWTLTPAAGVNPWDLTTNTGLTLSCASATLTVVQTNVNAGGAFFNQGTGTTYGTINMGACPFSVTTRCISFQNVSWTVGTLNITTPNIILFPSGSNTTTITNAPTWAGTAGTELLISSALSGGTNSSTVNVGGATTLAWVALRGIHFGTSAVTANNSFDLGFNTMNGGIINAPAPSGGGGTANIIGGM